MGAQRRLLRVVAAPPPEESRRDLNAMTLADVEAIVTKAWTLRQQYPTHWRDIVSSAHLVDLQQTRAAAKGGA
jgi:hypothetical protein